MSKSAETPSGDFSMPSTREIAELAYELFQRRGGLAGHDLDDWLEAERELMATSGVPCDTTPVASPSTGRHGATIEP